MVALDSSGSSDAPRSLEQRTLDELRDALLSRMRADADADTRLRGALRSAAEEARTRGLRPEELIIVLKSVGQEADRLEHHGSHLSLAERRRILDTMVPAVLKAYFSQ